MNTAFCIGGVAAILAICAPGCSKQPQPEKGPAMASLVAQIEPFAAASASSSRLVIPPGTDTWLVAVPYELEENWSSLGLNCSDADKDRLVQANTADENVLLARITPAGLSEIAILGPQFDAAPNAFVAHAGDTLVLQRRQDSRPILITRGSE